MRGIVTVQSTDEFQKWLEDMIAEQAGAADDPFR
jgi:heme/copper-type cytochrome/quinol oxidase subunit 2